MTTIDEPGSAAMTAETSKTRREIAGRLDEIAPYPKPDTPDHARALAKYLAVSAQRRWKYTLDILDIADMDSVEYRLSVQAVVGEFAALHLLMSADPARAENLSHQIRDAWDDGGDIGPWLWEHAMALGIDTDEVSRLEEAWWAASGAPAETTESPAGDSEDELTKLRNACQLLGKVVTGQGRAMEAARIELAQGDAREAMEWILNSLPDVDDNDPVDQWNGTETAQEWFDRTDERNWPVPEEAPQLSPAELEAAGQLPLPGVTA